MEPHTNITNEITGAYYEENDTPRWFNIIFNTFIGIVFILVILDFIFGAENVTNFIAELVTKFG